MTDYIYYYSIYSALGGFGMGLFNFLIFALLSPYFAGLLWAFGVHMAKIKEKKYINYYGAICLCVLSLSILQTLFCTIAFEIKSDPRILIFVFSLLLFFLQSFFSISFSKLILNTTWKKSYIAWFPLLFVWFLLLMFCWIIIFSMA